MQKEPYVQIRERRKELGLTQPELGARLNPPVTQPAISAWEKGREPVPEDRWADIARALETSVERLLGDMQYVRTVEEMKTLWRDAVMNDQELSGDAQVVLLWVGLLAEVPEAGPLEFKGSIEDVDAQLRAFTLDEIEAVWPEVLASSYVEAHPTAKWSLKLTVPRRH